MKIKNKQIACNHSSDIGFKGFMQIYNKCNLFLSLRHILSEDALRFGKKYLEGLHNNHKTDEKIRGEKVLSILYQ